MSNLTNLTASGTWDAIVVVEKHVNRELDAQFDKHRLDDEAFDKEVNLVVKYYRLLKYIFSIQKCTMSFYV